MNKLLSFLTARFRQLRWKLTLSYTLVTVAALLVVEVALIAGLTINLAKESSVNPQAMLNELKMDYASLVSSFLSETPPDVEGLREFLGQLEVSATDAKPLKLGNFSFSAFTTNIFSIIFLTSEGELIDTLPHSFLENTKVGETFDISEIPGLKEPLQGALAGETELHRLYTYNSENRMVGAIPVYRKTDDAKVEIIEKYIHDAQITGNLDLRTWLLAEEETGQVVGALAFERKMGFWEVWTFSQIAKPISISLLFITLVAALLGTVFGSFTARGLVGRLRRLFASARSWSEGDFSVLIDDPSGDELGQLAQGLNNMATQLEHLLEERQQISVMEERNRLARDLHDSVKQQTFAASAQLGAALTHFKPDPEEAEVHLVEAERLLDEVRQELTDLIRELRPVALKGRGLATAVCEYASDCANQTNIDIDVHVQGERPLPLETEQTLFRIVQGTLANIVQHSQASHASILLNYGPSTITLTVSDNGRGFDTNKRHNRLGLRSIQERVELIKGNLRIESDFGKGTKVTVKCHC